MDSSLGKNKTSKFILYGAIALFLLIATILFASYTYKNENRQLVTIYYQQINSAGPKETKTAVLDVKGIQTLQNFLSKIKYDRYADDLIYDINDPAYKIEGEHKNSSNLDFNYYVYIRKDHYIVMNAFEGRYALVYHDDYDFLKSFLSLENLNNLPQRAIK